MLRSSKRSFDDLQQQQQIDSFPVIGKWTLAEEKYAWDLINDFEAGLLSKGTIIVLVFFSYFYFSIHSRLSRWLYSAIIPLS
jgi:hypothetical protein